MGKGTNQIATRSEVYNIGQQGTLSENTRGCTYTQAAAYGIPVTGSSKLITYDDVVLTTKPFQPHLYICLNKEGYYFNSTYFDGNLSLASWHYTESDASTGPKMLIAEDPLEDSLINGTVSSNFPHYLNISWTYKSSRYVITRVYCKTQNWAVGSSDTSLNQVVNYVNSTYVQPTIIIKDNNTSKYTALVYIFYRS